MKIIVDAYNVLKKFNHGYIDERERLIFIKKIEKYIKKKSCRAVVVFDGGGHNWPQEERKGLLTIVYSGRILSADGYIFKYMKRQGKKEIVVVSDDNEIVKDAKRKEFEILDSNTFYSFISLASEKIKKQVTNDCSIKLSTINIPELDKLMEESSVEKLELDQYEKENRKSCGFTVSKKERKINKIKKKLRIT